MEFISESSIKESFQKVKKDISFLSNELFGMKQELAETRKEIIKICEILENLVSKIEEKGPKTPIQAIPAFPTHEPANPTFPAHNPAHNHTVEPLNPKIQCFSTGNQGVPTDRQTNQQTDKYPQNLSENQFFPVQQAMQSPIENAAKMLDSLDSLKKEIRLKFKQLTDQEILVFSTLYQLEEEQGPVEYKALAQKLSLTESSIRDYIGRLLKKGIPVEKKRINNKQIQVSISQNLKKIASLSTILQLRDI
ncbi:MAG: helix-turn-helix domain-containing protein [Candidatus Pacearchaeota archaeon]|nr:helix-turn-helix domain-containing protein [Candidatus Pacearchaeota archaeon]